eukprot:TRINITY_DN9012_c0_g1_i1.p1 TRINITY_DN9012_c0_g1~~TRINITY_DN9012_c0_g1_i1.p1  ORF type:complete len:429 (+),score=86.09 TRINITY_DN9012_c0_g1_i1:25-1311(+)
MPTLRPTKTMIISVMFLLFWGTNLYLYYDITHTPPTPNVIDYPNPVADVDDATGDGSFSDVDTTVGIVGEDDELGLTAVNPLGLNISGIEHNLQFVQEINNEPYMNPHFKLAKDHIPIIIRGFDKTRYLKKVLEAWKQVTNIHETVIIVSFDGIFPDSIKAVREVDFCRVKIVINPFSGNLYKDRFPGRDPTVCVNEADQYGNERPYPYTNGKHHFWWIANYAFDSLWVNTNAIAFFEEDHLPDMVTYDLLKSVYSKRNELCEECAGIALGSHVDAKPKTEKHFLDSIALRPVTPNLGLVLFRSSWKMLKDRTDHFCTFDDYNWDLTLTQAGPRDILPKHYIYIEYNHIVHIGACGAFKHREQNPDCAIPQKLLKMYDKIQSIVNDFDPYSTEFKVNGKSTARLHKGFGGWGCSRDHELCMDIAKLYG